MKPQKAADKLRKKGVKPQEITKARIAIWRRELEQIERSSHARHKGSKAGNAGKTGSALWRYIASFVEAGRVAYISYEKLAEALDVCVSAVKEGVQRLVRIDALVVIPQYDWVGGKWVRRPNVYKLRRPKFEARFMPLFKRLRGVKKAAKDLLADVQKSFGRASKVSETPAEPAKGIKAAEATASPPETELALLAKSGFSVKSGPPSRLEVMLAHLGRCVAGRNTAPSG